MPRTSLARLLLALVVLSPWASARAAELQLRVGFANQLPRVVAPDNAATRRINAALAAGDRAFEAMTASCRAASPHPYAKRKVKVTARGPALLAFVTEDQTDCGGVYPNTGTLALVFDLASGRFVDWTRWLPTGAVASRQEEAGTDFTLGTIAWPPLKTAYLARYRTTPALAAAVGRDNIETCAGVVTDDNDFILWPNSHARALVAQPVGLPHAAAACEVPVAFDAAALKALGLTPAAITAITGR